MKKSFLVFLIVLCVFGMVACKQEPEPKAEPKHEHTFSDTWSSDETDHWHAATCEHADEVSGKAAHTWDSGTDNENGKITYKCTVCEKTRTTYKTYEIGDEGPGGGLVFYDCDADNDETNDGAGPDGLKSDVCGWRYLECVAADLDLPFHCFGYYRESDAASNQVVGTSQGIGTGKENTEKLLAAMGDEAYSASTGSDKTANYAARLCDEYSAGGKDDWFLPSRDELNLMYVNLCKAGLGGFEWSYCSSSEKNEFLVYDQSFYDGMKADASRYNNSNFRPVRAF
jgi:hypothetical protein